MVKNVGTMDAYLRVTGGLMMLAFGAAAMVRRPGLSQALMIGLGAAKVAEGITRYDPMYRAIGWSTLEKNPLAEMGDMVTGVNRQASHYIDEMSHHAGHAVDEMSHHAGHAADQMTHQAGHAADQMAQTAERVTDNAERAGDRATRAANRIVRRAEDYMS